MDDPADVAPKDGAAVAGDAAEDEDALAAIDEEGVAGPPLAKLAPAEMEEEEGTAATPATAEGIGAAS